MRLRFLAVLGLLGLVACSSTPNNPHPTVDAGPGSSVGRTCNVDAECPGLRCDSVRHTCICLSDADCTKADGGAAYCSNFTGLCVDSVPGCTSDADCTSGNPNSFCNPETRACQALRGFCETCHSDVECGTGNHCLADDSLKQNFCSKQCSAPTDCPTGTTCTAVAAGDNQCLPNAGTDCKTFTGCTPDSLKSCNSNADCAEGDGGSDDQVCDVASGVCRARQQICPLGTICDPSVRVCVNSCSVDRDCDTGLACVNHLCQPLSTCASDTDCPTDKVCDVPAGASGGTCVPFCQSDTDCSVSRVCQPVIEPDGSTRQACLPGCVHDTDCDPDQLCLDSAGNRFVEVDGGTALGLCKSSYQGRPACQGTESCPTCDLCMADNTCQADATLGFCHPCDPSRGNADCTTYGTDATCLSLGGRDSNGNILGSGPFACGVPCKPLGTADGASCPSGFICAALNDSAGNPTGVYNCVPSDFNCGLNSSAPRCP